MSKFHLISKEQYDKDFNDVALVPYQYLKLPKRATAGSAGYDFIATRDIWLMPGETIKIPTGVKVQLEPDQVLFIVPRSSLGCKYRLQLDNTVAVIDADYYNNPNNEGHIWLKLSNDGSRPIGIKAGDAIVQGIIVRYDITDDDRASEKRIGGFGSTNR